MITTPRTDAAQKRHTYLNSSSLPPGCLSSEFADFARQLETELAAEKARVDNATTAAESWAGQYKAACRRAEVMKVRADAFEQATQGERNIHMTTIAERDSLAAQLAAERAKVAELIECLEGFERIRDIWLPEKADEEHAEEIMVLHMARQNMLAAMAKASTGGAT